jgi:hypothetical protein
LFTLKIEFLGHDEVYIDLQLAGVSEEFAVSIISEEVVQRRD